MPRLIWVFAGRTGNIVGFVMQRFTLGGLTVRDLTYKVGYKQVYCQGPHLQSWLQTGLLSGTAPTKLVTNRSTVSLQSWLQTGLLSGTAPTKLVTNKSTVRDRTYKVGYKQVYCQGPHLQSWLQTGILSGTAPTKLVTNRSTVRDRTYKVGYKQVYCQPTKLVTNRCTVRDHTYKVGYKQVYWNGHKTLYITWLLHCYDYFHYLGNFLWVLCSYFI